MTDMPGNPHYGMSLPDAAATGDGRAIADATLALAYEQRTANLIALITAEWPAGRSMFPGQIDEVRYQVLERLGLNDA